MKSEQVPLNPSPGRCNALAGIRHLEQAARGARWTKGIGLRYGTFDGPVPSMALGEAQLGLVRGRKFPLVGDGDRAPVAEWLPALAPELSAKEPMRGPRFIGRLFAGEADMVMTDARGAANATAKRELAWRPAHLSWRQGFRAP